MSAALSEYTVHINGVPHTMLLSEADARARGLLDEETAPAQVGDIEAALAERESELLKEHEAAIAELRKEHETAIAEVRTDAEAKAAEAVKAALAERDNAEANKQSGRPKAPAK